METGSPLESLLTIVPILLEGEWVIELGEISFSELGLLGWSRTEEVGLNLSDFSDSIIERPVDTGSEEE